LPVPVCAMPYRSRPQRTGGMAWRWIGVGPEYPSAVRALRMGAESSKSEKLVKAVTASRVEGRRAQTNAPPRSKTTRAIRAVQCWQGIKMGPRPPHRWVAHARPFTCFRWEARIPQLLYAATVCRDQAQSGRGGRPLYSGPKALRSNPINLAGFADKRSLQIAPGTSQLGGLCTFEGRIEKDRVIPSPTRNRLHRLCRVPGIAIIYNSHTGGGIG
jgi:hypothetical protein